MTWQKWGGSSYNINEIPITENLIRITEDGTEYILTYNEGGTWVFGLDTVIENREYKFIDSSEL